MESTSSRIRLRSDAVVSRTVDGEIVALDLQGSRYLTINAAGAVLWPHLLEGASSETLASELTARFGIDRQRALADVECFLGTLHTLDLLEETA
jgi:coenzyme PQQ synthesis protein D (PqqD)